ncbi:MAG TPA: hypothetical protein DCM02_10690 [Flavobacterium sp.]|nr:hypothetical protein [Flavobacterium sp.]
MGHSKEDILQSLDWKDFFETMPFPAIILNKELSIILYNEAFRSFSGKTDTEIKQAKCYHFYGPDKNICEDEKCPIQCLFKKQTFQSEVSEFSAFDKSYLAHCAPIHKDGEVIGVLHLATDITELKNVKDALTWSEKRFHFAMEATGDGIWDWDAKTNKVFFSKKWKEMLGYSENEIENNLSEWETRIHPEDKEKCMLLLNQHFQGDTDIYISEHRLKCKDGSYKWILDRGKVIQFDKNGKPIRAIGTHKDIDFKKQMEIALIEKNEEIEAQNEEYYTLNEELKEASEQLQKSNIELNNLINNMMHGLALHEVIYNEKGEVIDYRFLSVNDSYERLTGLKRENIIGKTVLEVLPTVEKYWIEKFGEVALTGKNLHYENYTEPIGRYFETLSYRPAPHQFVAIINDITDRKLAELAIKKKNEEFEAQNEEYLQVNEELKQSNEELYRAKEKAEESDKLKSAFLANLSHEIRTPMNGIMGFTELLSDPNLSKEKLNKYINIIKKSGTQLLSIINDIVEISKIDTRQIQINSSIIELSDLINNLYFTFKLTIPSEKRIEMIVEMPEKKLCIEIDQVKLQQVLSNLITNAIKFTDVGKITIGYKVIDQENIQFFVKDTGIGIDPKYHKVIFDRFRQIDIETSSKFGGSGLGLAISKAYVELLGGEITIQSSLGKGSSFYIDIPIKKTKKKGNCEEESGIQKLNLNQTNSLLIAEDDEINYYYLEELFSGSSFEIIRANNGKEAVEACKINQNIKLVLMDLKMPVMDGYEATKQIKNINPSITVIAQTAYALSDDETKSRIAGCDDYITKPIHKEKLFELIKKYINH